MLALIQNRLLIPPLKNKPVLLQLHIKTGTQDQPVSLKSYFFILSRTIFYSKKQYDYLLSVAHLFLLPYIWFRKLNTTNILN